MPWPEPISAVQCRDLELDFIPVGLPPEGFAENDGCSKLMDGIEVEIDCAVLCHNEPKDSCVTFYFNKARKECRLVLYTDATIDMGNARGWKKFIVKK